VDLVTSTHIFEVKKYQEWKSALGQILAYSDYFPQLTRVVYLFAEQEDAKKANSMAQIAKKTCQSNGVELVLDILAQRRRRFVL
jgi:hypothetical protein